MDHLWWGGRVRGPVSSRFQTLRRMNAALAFELRDGPPRRPGRHSARLLGQRRRKKIRALCRFAKRPRGSCCIVDSSD